MPAVIPCPSCAGAMTSLGAIELRPDGSDDPRTAEFIAQALERDPAREGSTWRVYASRDCCGCDCRRYIPV